MKKTFVCDFGGGLTCTAVINTTRLFNGKNHVLGMQWSIPLTAERFPEVLPKYREWVHSINSDAVNRTRKSMLYCLQVSASSKGRYSGGWEMWSYQPDKPPVLERFHDDTKGNP